MKNIALIIVLTICFSVSCSKDTTTNEPTAPEINNSTLKLSPNEITNAPQIGGIFKIMLTANKKWSAASNCKWASVNPKSGDIVENQLITITIGASEETSNRVANIIFNCDDISDTIIVSQLPKSCIIIGESSYSIEGYAQNININVNTNIDIDVEIPDNIKWIDLSSPLSKNLEQKSFSFDIEENVNEQREAIITFKDRNSDISQDVLIIQNSKGIIFPGDGEPSPIFSSSAGSENIKFSASQEWKASIISETSDEWLSITPTSGTKGSGKITINAKNNDSPHDRFGSVKITSGQSTRIIKVLQQQRDSIIVTPSEILIGANITQFKIDVSSNIGFMVNVKSPWITQNSTKAITTTELLFTAQKNSGETRVGTIIISSTEGSDTIKVIQNSDIFNVKLDKTQIPNTGGVVTATVESNMEYTVEIPSNIDWITESNQKGTNIQNHIFNIKPNREVASRNATIKFNYQSHSGGSDVKEVVVNQDGYGITVNKDIYRLDEKGGQIKVIVEADTELGPDIQYNITKGADWIEKSQNSRTISKNFIFTVHSNTTEAPREGEIIFTLRDKSSAKVTIIQSANNNTISISDTNFRNYLIREFDLDSDGEISNHEASLISEINCSKLSINSLNGVEHFINISTLNCSHNNLTSIDLSKNKLLTSLNLSYNELKTVDISNLTKVTDLSCNYNPLEIINLGSVKPNKFYDGEIANIYYDYPLFILNSVKTFKFISSTTDILNLKIKGLTSLDLSECPKLEALHHHNNPLEELNLGDIELYVYYNMDNTGVINRYDHLALNLENSKTFKILSSKTTKINILSSELTSIDISKSPALKTLSVTHNRLTDIDVSKNVVLTKLNCEYNNLTSLNLDNNIELKELDCRANKLIQLDISKTLLPLSWSNYDDGVTVIR